MYFLAMYRLCWYRRAFTLWGIKQGREG